MYHLYVIRVQNRSHLQRYLKDSGIASAVYYPQPLHLAEPCRSLGYSEKSFPLSREASEETLAIPLYPGMSEEQLETVLAVLKECAVKAKVVPTKRRESLSTKD